VTYEVLATLNFDAARKRMSVIVRSPHTNKVYLMVKGADDAVYQRLADNDANASRKVRAHSRDRPLSLEGVWRILCMRPPCACRT
jgi:magnesium-transporting ATPase (P-type)